MIWIPNLVWKMICLIDMLGNQFKSSHNASGWLLDDSGEEKKKTDTMSYDFGCRKYSRYKKKAGGNEMQPGPPAAPPGAGSPAARHSLTYVDVTWETCAAAEPEQQRQQQQREEDRGDRGALQPHVSSRSRGATGVIPFTPGPWQIHRSPATDSHIYRQSASLSLLSLSVSVSLSKHP